MKMMLRGAVAGCLALASLGLQPAPAATYSGCYATYAGAGTACMFTPVGPNLSVSGTQYVESPYLLVVRIADPTGTVTIAYCSGGNYCFAQFGPSHTGTDSVGPPVSGPLMCQVISGSYGYINCSSGI